jgi:general secretion pathway protein G
MTDRNSPGFTLIEILVVVLIIGLLASVLATNLIGRGQEAQIKLVATQIQKLEASLEMYKLDNGRYPTQEQGLDALVRQPSGDPQPKRWSPYAKANQIKDPWGMPYQYRYPGEHNTHSFDLYSFGPDGTEGGDDEFADITNWDAESS